MPTSDHIPTIPNIVNRSRMTVESLESIGYRLDCLNRKLRGQPEDKPIRADEALDSPSPLARIGNSLDRMQYGTAGIFDLITQIEEVLGFGLPKDSPERVGSALNSTEAVDARIATRADNYALGSKL